MIIVLDVEEIGSKVEKHFFFFVYKTNYKKENQFFIFLVMLFTISFIFSISTSFECL